MTEVRTLRPDESIPDGLNTGFERMPIMPDWCWLAEEEGITQGILMAAPCHGLVYLARVCVKEEANKAVLLALFRALFRDTKARGFKVYITHLDPTKELESRLIGLCRETGGYQVTIPQVAVVGWLEERR
jgi:hypothetical protein